jgi:hypothetical protein
MRCAAAGACAQQSLLLSAAAAIQWLRTPGGARAKIKLNDARTLPPIDAREEWELENSGRIEVSRWDEVRMKQWPTQKLILYRVIEYKADG